MAILAEPLTDGNENQYLVQLINTSDSTVYQEFTATSSSSKNAPHLLPFAPGVIGTTRYIIASKTSNFKIRVLLKNGNATTGFQYGFDFGGFKEVRTTVIMPDKNTFVWVNYDQEDLKGGKCAGIEIWDVDEKDEGVGDNKDVVHDPFRFERVCGGVMDGGDDIWADNTIMTVLVKRDNWGGEGEVEGKLLEFRYLVLFVDPVAIDRYKAYFPAPTRFGPTVEDHLRSWDSLSDAKRETAFMKLQRINKKCFLGLELYLDENSVKNSREPLRMDWRVWEEIPLNERENTFKKLQLALKEHESGEATMAFHWVISDNVDYSNERKPADPQWDAASYRGVANHLQGEISELRKRDEGFNSDNEIDWCDDFRKRVKAVEMGERVAGLKWEFLAWEREAKRLRGMYKLSEE